MNCEWCTTGEAVCAGVPKRGPLSRMCASCRDRLCQKDEQGNFITIPLEEYMNKHKKEGES